MLLLSTPEIRAMAHVWARGQVPDVVQLRILERALTRIAQHDHMLDELAKASSPAEPPPKVPA